MSEKVLLPYRPDHPVLRPPTREQAQRIIAEGGVTAFNERMARRNAAIRREEEDPLHHGYELVVWKLADLAWGWITWQQFEADPRVPAEWKTAEVRALAQDPGAFLLVMGGNRASKTYYMLKRLVECAVKHAGAYFWCFHQNNDMSVIQHQKLVNDLLPRDWREAGKGRVAYVSYTVKNGFSDNRLVGPNGTIIEFRNYEQDIKSLEGPELGAPDRSTCLGYVADELAPLEFIDTLRFRLVTRASVGMLGFTAIDGYTPTVGHALDGATTLLERVAEHLETPIAVPLLQRSQNKSRRVVYFHSEFNPYGNFAQLLKETASDPDPVRRVRLYGFPHKAREVAFPRFSDQVHVKPASAFPKELTWYMVCDPGGARRKNMAMAWFGVDAFERVWIAREWPCPRHRIPGHGFPAPWAKPGRQKGYTHDGVPDEGSKTLGWGLVDYKEEIARIEGWEDARTNKPIEQWEDRNGVRDMPVLVRYIDSRFASTGSYTSTGSTTLLEEFANLGLYFEPTAGQSSSGRIEEGVDLIEDRLAFKPDWQDPKDGPGLFVCDECENTIFMFKTWTGQDGSKSATKDWLDVVRYALKAQICHVRSAPGAEKRPSWQTKARFFKEGGAR
jgi:hypothetical protein